MAVDNEELVLDWEGQTITKKVDEILDRSTAAPPAPGPAAASAATPTPPRVVAPAPPVPGGDLSAGVKSCQPGDSSPAGTVADGMKKVIMPTPFGSKCYWESDK